MDTMQDNFADIRDSEEKSFDCWFLKTNLGYYMETA